MNDLLLDVWNDLREKRLWPVAVVLALGLLVVPITLGRSSGDDASEPMRVPQQAPTKGGPKVEAAEVQASSKLDVFDSKDPFKPGVETPAPGAGTVDGGGQAVVPGGAGGGAAGGGVSSPPAGPSDPSGPSAGGGPGAGTTPAGPPAASPTPSKPRSKLFSYVVDIDFGRSGRERKRRNVKRLTILPDARRPLLVFLGVTADRKRAVFLADSTVGQSGEGKCRPDVRTCTFIYLSTEAEHNEHFIADSEGREYGLTLRRIKALEIKPKRASTSRASRLRRARAAERRRRRAERDGEKTVFHLPLFADSRR